MNRFENHRELKEIKATEHVLNSSHPLTGVFLGYRSVFKENFGHSSQALFLTFEGYYVWTTWTTGIVEAMEDNGIHRDNAVFVSVVRNYQGWSNWRIDVKKI